MSHQAVERDELYLLICKHRNGEDTLGAIEGRQQAQAYCKRLNDYQKALPQGRAQCINQAEEEEDKQAYAKWLADHHFQRFARLNPSFRVEHIEWLTVGPAQSAT